MAIYLQRKRENEILPKNGKVVEHGMRRSKSHAKRNATIPVINYLQMPYSKDFTQLSCRI